MPDLKIHKYYFLFLFLQFYAIVTFSQTIITGKITDAATGEALGFVNVFIKGSQNRTTSDFEGYYKLIINKPTNADSISFANIGYKTKKKHYEKGKNQTIDIQLDPVLLNTREVIIRPRENTSYAMIKKAIAQRDKVDRSNLQSYENETYKRIELDIDNISQKLRKKKAMREIAALLDSTKNISGEEGKSLLPFYIVEKYGKHFVKNKPIFDEKNILEAQKIKGLGLGDESYLSQLYEMAFKEYNFNKNWVKIVNKDIASPLSENWKIYYDYFISDSMYIGKEWSFKLEVLPKNNLDPVFHGHIWIADSSWAIKRLDLTVDKSANLNFVELIKVKQELEPTSEGIYLPVKTRILVDVAEPTDSAAGLIAKYYVTNTNFKTNQNYEDNFWKESEIINEDADTKDNSFWEKNRPDILTQAEKNVYKMIDTIKSLPTVKTYIEILDIALNGYYRTKYVDFGPYPYIIGYNNVEGIRLRLGLKTNPALSKKFTLRSFLAYGVSDNKFKYENNLAFHLSRRRWTTLTFFNHYDIEQLGLYNDLPGQTPNNPIFVAIARLGTLKRPYWHQENSVTLEREFRKGIILGSQFKLFNFNHHPTLFGSDFKFISSDNLSNKAEVSTSELTLYGRFSYKELWVNFGNERSSLGVTNSPIVNVYYTKGFKNVLNGSFDYQKYQANLLYRFKTSIFGSARIFVAGGFIEGKLPYPLLKSHLGNQSVIFNQNSFNMMNFFEFVSDKYASFSYEQHFDGFFFNRIPLIKKLKWRELASVKLLWGEVAQKNKDIIPNYEQFPPFSALNSNIKYGEISYGIENVKKVFRFEVFHRLNYLNEPYNIQKIRLKLSFQFTL